MKNVPVQAVPFLDVSVPLSPAIPVWPGDPAFRIERLVSLPGGGMNLSSVSMSLHTGTHMDAPLHFLDGGAPMDAMPLDATVGPARVIAIRDPESVKPEELRGIARGERLLFRTRNSERRWAASGFFEDFVYISKEAAQLLAETGVVSVGVDYLSVGGFRRDGPETHRILLGAGIWIIEGLDLSAVEPGEYDLICLPLRVVGADGAPARAILRRRVS